MVSAVGASASPARWFEACPSPLATPIGARSWGIRPAWDWAAYGICVADRDAKAGDQCAQDRSGRARKPGLTPAHCPGTVHKRRTLELPGSPPRQAGCGSARRPNVSSRRANGCRCPGNDCSGIYSTAARTRRFTPRAKFRHQPSLRSTDWHLPEFGTCSASTTLARSSC